MKYVLFITGIFLSILSLAATNWPTKLTDLSIEQQNQIQNEMQIKFDISKFKFDRIIYTTPNHGIVTYFHQYLDVCSDGTHEFSNEYISLYVDGAKIKFITTFANYACHED